MARADDRPTEGSDLAGSGVERHGGARPSRSPRRRARLRTALLVAIGLAGIVVGCTSAPPPAEVRGLLTLDRTGLHGWLGPADRLPREVSIPGAPADATGLAVSADGRLAVSTDASDLRVSDVISADDLHPGPTWRTITLTTAAGEPLGAFLRLPVWSPSGSRIAVIGHVTEDGQLLIVDAASGVAVPMASAPDELPSRAAWVDDDTLAVTLWIGDTSTVRNVLVDAMTGAVSDAPLRSVWAASPGGSLVLTTDARRPGTGPFAVETTDTWLRGEDRSRVTIAESPDTAAYDAFSFDADGARLVLTTVQDDGRLVDRIHTAAAGWAEVAATGARDRNGFIGNGWLP